jgi:NADH-quinone oxidoreductase subunit C
MVSAGGLKRAARSADKRLVAIVCVQEGGKFRLEYIFDDKGTDAVLTVRVPVKNPVIDSLMDIFPVAELFEREIHDFFGVEFKGNRRLHDKLFLPENYKGSPPLRKGGHKHA